MRHGRAPSSTSYMKRETGPEIETGPTKREIYLGKTECDRASEKKSFKAWIPETLLPAVSTSHSDAYSESKIYFHNYFYSHLFFNLIIILHRIELLYSHHISLRKKFNLMRENNLFEGLFLIQTKDSFKVVSIHEN